MNTQQPTVSEPNSMGGMNTEEKALIEPKFGDREVLEVAKEECGRLERENAKLKRKNFVYAEANNALAAERDGLLAWKINAQITLDYDKVQLDALSDVIEATKAALNAEEDTA